MTIFIREKNGIYYLVVRHREGRQRKERWLRLDGKNLEILKNAMKIKEEIDKNKVEVTCMNPYCSNKIAMTVEQKRDLLISFKKKYDKAVLVCCSEKCRKEVLELLK